jgi:hypothetical protein
MPPPTDCNRLHGFSYTGVQQNEKVVHSGVDRATAARGVGKEVGGVCKILKLERSSRPDSVILTRSSIMVPRYEIWE